MSVKYAMAQFRLNELGCIKHSVQYIKVTIISAKHLKDGCCLGWQHVLTTCGWCLTEGAQCKRSDNRRTVDSRRMDTYLYCCVYQCTSINITPNCLPRTKLTSYCLMTTENMHALFRDSPEPRLWLRLKGSSMAIP